MLDDHAEDGAKHVFKKDDVKWTSRCQKMERQNELPKLIEGTFVDGSP